MLNLSDQTLKLNSVEHTCRRFFFQEGGKKTPSRLSHFYQPDFPISLTFWDKKTQPSFLAVFSRLFGLQGGGGVKDPQTSFSLKLAQKCLKLFLILLHLTQHGSIKSGGNILLFILKLMLKFLICFGELLSIVQVAPLQTRFLKIHDNEHSIVQCR